MKNLVGRAEWDQKSHSRDDSSPDSEQNVVLSLIQSLEISVKWMEDKIDFLTMCLGFQHPTLVSGAATKLEGTKSSQPFTQDLSYVLL